MIISTLQTYDSDKYEIIGPVSGMSIHSISFIRNIFSGFTSLFGGKQDSIKTKFMDVRNESIKEMIQIAKNNNSDMISGLIIELTELGAEFVVCIATGTALKLKEEKKEIKKQSPLLYKKTKSK